MTTLAPATAFYVYGVVPADATLPPLVHDGVDPAYTPELVASDELAAVTNRVRVPEPDAPAPATDEIVARALTHGAVLDELLAAGLPVVPFRFGATYADVDAIRILLRDRRSELVAALRRVAGRVELGVKAYADAERLAAAARARDDRIARLESELAGASPGTAHLRRKQLERLRADAEAAARLALAEDLHAELAAAALDARANAPASAVLDAAYLVERGSEAEFRRAALAAGAAAGVRVELTGPWPAYNFVTGETDAHG